MGVAPKAWVSTYLYYGLMTGVIWGILILGQPHLKPPSTVYNNL